MTNPTGTGVPGQLGLTDGNTPENATDSLIDAALGRLAIVKLVKIEAVHPGDDGVSGTVDALPLVNIIDGLGQSSKLATVFGIQYLRLQGGKNAVVIDPVVGDIGIVIVADRDTSAAIAARGQANPGSFRRFSMSDGIYIGGICNAKPEQKIEFGDGIITVTDKTGNVLLMDSNGITATPKTGLPFKIVGDLVVTGAFQLGGLLLAIGGAIYAGIIQTLGDVLAGGKSLKTHTHTQPNDSHGDTEQPTSPPV